MKKLLYNIYALLFNISTLLFPVKENRIALISMHNENFRDSLGSIYEYLKKEDKYRFVLITREDLSIRRPFSVISFFLNKSRLLATSKYVFLNDNFMPMGKLNFKKETVITQLWHGEGAFKKFGLDIPQKDDLRKREIAGNKKLTYVVCSSEGVRDIYSSAFGVEKERVLPLGSPRLDYLFGDGNEKKARAELEEFYPEAKGKKVVLYAPTFRDDPEKDKQLLDGFDSKELLSSLGEEYFLLVKLHPQIHSANTEAFRHINATDYPDVRNLVLACDVLVTDYSSICMDFCVLDKKTVFYCPDLEWYKERRDFYFDYKAFVPGEVCEKSDDLAQKIKSDFCRQRNEAFKNKNFGFTDNRNCERITDYIIK